MFARLAFITVFGINNLTAPAKAFVVCLGSEQYLQSAIFDEMVRKLSSQFFRRCKLRTHVIREHMYGTPIRISRANSLVEVVVRRSKPRSSQCHEFMKRRPGRKVKKRRWGAKSGAAR